MKSATKALILSGLVYPGTGQLFLGRTCAGLGIIIFATTALVVFVLRMAARIYLSLDPLLERLATKSLTFENIQAILSQTGYTGWDPELISLSVFVFCWLAAMVHAYCAGLNQNSRQNSESRSQ
jgi:hypothetical protein